jgi:PAS domain S-box-containing protein
MKNEGITKEQLMNELKEMRQRMSQLEVLNAERKFIENELRRSEEKYRTVADFTYDWEWWKDPQGYYKYVSPSCERITGYRPEEFIADPNLIIKIAHPDDRSIITEHFNKSLQNDADVYHLDYRIISRSGEVRWISHYCQPINNKEGIYLGRRGSSRDITERKQIEQRLKESEESYKKLISAITAYTYSVEIIDGRAITTHRSPGCISITGYTPEDYISDPDLWYTMIYPDDRARVQSTLNNVLSGKEASPIEHRLIRRDGEVIWVRNTIVPFYNINKRLLKYDGMIEDITKRKDTEEQIRQLNDELEQKIVQLTGINKALDLFNRSVSHDLQAPLMVVGGFAGRLLKIYGDTLEADAIDMINTIQISAQKMERLIKDLLAFSRSARQEIKSVKINMTNLIGTVIDELKPLSEGRTVKFDINTLAPAFGDIGLIKQVLTNLLSNAIKFTTTKEIAIIEVDCRVEETENIYYVKDNGIGFDSQHTDKLFAPFTRLPEAKEFDGTGIGLSIVERIINRHGGRVWAKGKINEGATFYFSLPNIERKQGGNE